MPRGLLSTYVWLARENCGTVERCRAGVLLDDFECVDIDELPESHSAVNKESCNRKASKAYLGGLVSGSGQEVCSIRAELHIHHLSFMHVCDSIVKFAALRIPLAD